MSAAALVSGIASSLVSCALWEGVRLAHHAAVRAVKGPAGRHCR